MSNSTTNFFDGWSMADDALRLRKISAAFDPQGSYADPMTDAPLEGAEAVSDYVGNFTKAAPGATVSVVKSDTRHGVERATISFQMADGNAQTGQYFVEHGTDGRIVRMVGFVGTGAPE